MATSPHTRPPSWTRPWLLIVPVVLVSLLAAPSALATGDPPVNTQRPAITGSARYGQTLAGNQGLWTGTEPITYTNQWRRCDVEGNNCTDILSATSLSYTLDVADIGARLTLRVTATNAYGSASQRSWLSATVVSPPINTVLPSLSGIARRGETLSVAPGSWIGTAPLGYAYQWRRCDVDGNNCQDVAGATSAGYLLGQTDVGKRLQARVTATNSYGSAVKRTWNSAVVADTARRRRLLRRHPHLRRHVRISGRCSTARGSSTRMHSVRVCSTALRPRGSNGFGSTSAGRRSRRRRAPSSASGT